MFLCEIVEEINANKDGEREHCGRPDTVPKQNMDEQITGERIGEITENIGANFCCVFLLHLFLYHIKKAVGLKEVQKKLSEDVEGFMYQKQLHK